MLIHVLIEDNPEFVCQRQQQTARFQIGIRNISGDELRGVLSGSIFVLSTDNSGRSRFVAVKRGKKFAAQQRFAVTHLTYNLDETFTISRRHQ